MIETRTDRTGKAKYRVRIAVTDPLTGHVKHQQVGVFTTRREAQTAERKALVERDSGTLRAPTKMTVAQLLDDWLAHKQGEISANAWTDYHGTIERHLKPALGGIPVQALKADRVQQQYTAWREAGLSARAIQCCHLRLSQALDQAVRHNLVVANVCKSVTAPRLERKAVDVWTPAEAATFLTSAVKDALHPLWHLLVLEGLRRGEALGLRWADVDLERGTAHVTQTVIANKADKGKALIQPRAKTAAGARSVRLMPETLAALKEHRKRQAERRLAASDWQDHDLIICTGRGTPIQPGGNVTRSFEHIILDAGLRRIRVHDLRHTSATLLLLAGVPAKIVSERLGHASISITLDIYSHVLPDMQESAVEALGAVLAKAREAQLA